MSVTQHAPVTLAKVGDLTPNGRATYGWHANHRGHMIALKIAVKLCGTKSPH